MLTTHYISLCNMMNENINIENNQMEYGGCKEETPHYTYKLKSGISNIKGGIKVLEELEYSNEILVSAKEAIKKIDI